MKTIIYLGIGFICGVVYEMVMKLPTNNNKSSTDKHSFVSTMNGIPKPRGPIFPEKEIY